MMRKTAILATIGLVHAFVVATTVAAQTSVVRSTPSLTGSWQLDFRFHDLQRIDVRLPGDRHATSYWYMLYTVTNNTGRDVEFYPTFELVTDTMQVVTAGDEISPSVYDAIRGRHKKMYPFFRTPIDASGKVLQGADNARTSVAVFHDFDANASSLKVFVAGLSGEIERLGNPVYDENQPESAQNRRFFTLRKTLAIGYDLPGDPQTRRSAEPMRRGWDWVMR